MEKSPKIILGIDPGTLAMGYCVIHASGGKLTMKEMDVLKLNSKHDNYRRLKHIYVKVQDLITAFDPNCFAIEAPFFGKNVQSMLKLGRAQGVAIAAAMAAGLEVCEYSPRKIKQSITGNGNSDKEQVWKMLQQILGIGQSDHRGYDASDAMAVAVCHHFQEKITMPRATAKLSGWGAFIAANPGRVK